MEIREYNTDNSIEDYAEYSPSAFYIEDYSPPKPLWLKRLVVIGLFLTVLSLFLGVSVEQFGGVLLAYINCVISGIAFVKLANKRSLSCLFPMVFILWMVLGQCLGAIYFAVFQPDISYGWHQTLYLYENAKMQIVIMTFLVPYLMITFYTLRDERPCPVFDFSSARRLNLISLILFSIASLLFCITKLFNIPGHGFAVTFFNYLVCLPLILGVQITSVRRIEKYYIIALFAFLLFFFALSSTRRNAVIPIMAFMMGFFFVSQVKTRTKLMIISIILVALPTYMVLGNTVRTVLQGSGVGGGFEDMGYRLSAMKRWKEVAEQADWATSTFARFFFTGGHSIITKTPSENPFMGFSPVQYIIEIGATVVPGFLRNYVEFWIQAKYTGNMVLNNYGFQLSEEHQVGVSILGHYWLLGGYPFVIIGAIFIGFFQKIVINVMNRYININPQKALFFGALLLPTMIWLPGKEFISTFRDFVWRVLLCMVCYSFVSLFLKNPDVTIQDEFSSQEYYDVQPPYDALDNVNNEGGFI